MIEIFFDDLTEEAQEKVIKELGTKIEDINLEFPIATIEIE